MKKKKNIDEYKNHKDNKDKEQKQEKKIENIVDEEKLNEEKIEREKQQKEGSDIITVNLKDKKILNEKFTREVLNKKPVDVVNNIYKEDIDFYDITNFYEVGEDLENKEYNLIKPDNINNNPYIVAVVKIVHKYTSDKNYYVISCTNYVYKGGVKGLFALNDCDKHIQQIKILASENINNMSYMFSGCNNVYSLDLSNLNTNNATNMRRMFAGCESLTKLNLSNFNTSNVTDMSYMFSRCSSLKELNLSNFNTNNVTNMDWMFFGCSYYLKRKIQSENKNIKDEAFY